MRKINEECGVFGMIDAQPQPAAHYAATALLALQHRGQEGCGIAYIKNVKGEEQLVVKKDVGLVTDVFTPEVIETLPDSRVACGHVRYSTTGDSTVENTQPMMTRHSKLTFAICHNGNITNADLLRNKMVNEGGKVFYSTNDTEIISKLIIDRMLKGDTAEEAVLSLMDIIEGAYSLVLVTKDKLIAARDPQGFRPLCLGKLDGSIVVASETCALDSIGAVYERDIQPGEVCSFSVNGKEQILKHKECKRALCVFEMIYIARPDSYIDGMSVYRTRIEMGRALARQLQTDADIVCGVPESGIDAAHGYSMESGIPFSTAFVRNRYVGRSFIVPTQAGRSRAVGLKLNPLSASVKGKRVVLVDDSIVRGTTSAKIIKMLREAGAKEIHLRISSPPFVAPCYFGVDVDSKENLISVKHSTEEICKMVGADSLVFLDYDEMMKIKDGQDVEYCSGCFTDVYPIDVNCAGNKNKFDGKR